MTAEVALLNREAVALAADSAVTVTYWEGGRRRVRFFKGANKIFNISEQYPVGMMIYDAGNLQGMPWEVIAKAYRSQRGNVPRNRLEDYANDLCDFIESDGHLFPREYQEKYLISRISDSFSRVCRVIRPGQGDEDKDLAPEQITDKVRENFGNFTKAVGEDEFIAGINQEFINEHIVPFFDQVFAEVTETDVYKALDGAVDPREIFNVATAAVFKVRFTTLQKTGLVIAGFGEHDFFPQLSSYICYGVFLGKVLCVKQANSSPPISHENVSEIMDFAQSEMVKTFIYGASISALLEIDKVFAHCIGGFVDDLKKAGSQLENMEFEQAIEKTFTEFRNMTTAYLQREHSQPLRKVIGMLPIDELAELAETLISIESLKERVTRPTESVSGPIDVAVISKSDGFIWIKRKHYFDPKLNPRFFARHGYVRERTHG